MRYKYVHGSSAEKYEQESGETTVFLATALETDGRVSIFDSTLLKGKGAPWHYHEEDDEIFYIISGEVEFGLNDDVIVAKAGDLLIAGPLVPRRFTALTDCHMLVINAPAGPSEGFLREITTINQPPTKDDMARFVEKYGIHILPN